MYVCLVESRDSILSSLRPPIEASISIDPHQESIDPEQKYMNPLNATDPHITISRPLMTLTTGRHFSSLTFLGKYIIVCFNILCLFLKIIRCKSVCCIKSTKVFGKFCRMWYIPCTWYSICTYKCYKNIRAPSGFANKCTHNLHVMKGQPL